MNPVSIMIISIFISLGVVGFVISIYTAKECKKLNDKLREKKK